MAATTLVGLIQELGQRTQDYASGTLSGTHATTFVQDNTRWEQDNTFKNGYLALTSGSQIGSERRITAYDGTTNVGRFTLAPALGAAPSTNDAYEVHMRWSRARKTAAINQAIHNLPTGFWRRTIDTSITTAQNTWAYALPPNVISVFVAEIQISLNMSGSGVFGQSGTGGFGFPYADAGAWNWRILESIAPDGTPTRYIAFGVQPPWPRTLRLFAAINQSELKADSDTLGAGQDDYDQRLQEWILMRSQVGLLRETLFGVPTEEVTRYAGVIQQLEKDAAALEPFLVMPHPAQAVVIPGSGDGQYHATALGREWLAAFSSPSSH